MIWVSIVQSENREETGGEKHIKIQDTRAKNQDPRHDD